MNDFEYDVKEKKRLAAGARHRVCGAKSKKCTLPHEYLSKKEVNALSGPVNTYNLNAPMSYAEFMRMPSDLRAEYLRKLNDRFDVSSVKLGEMLGVSRACVYNLWAEFGIPRTRKYARMTSGELKAWRSWLGSDTEDSETEEVAMLDTETAEQCLGVITKSDETELPTLPFTPAIDPSRIVTGSACTENVSTVKGGELTFHGTMGDIAAQISLILGLTADRHGEVKLSFGFDD